jgi:hypothetical protein
MCRLKKNTALFMTCFDAASPAMAAVAMYKPQVLLR